MMRMRNSILAQLGLVLVVIALIGSACSLSGGGDDGGRSDAQPTVPATITPPPTRTSFPTFTPFPTLTPGSGVQPFVPTATRIALLPTATFFPTFPAQPTVTSAPYDVRITYPVSGSQIAGFITIVGSASHPRFLQYALEYGPDPNPGNLWYALMAPSRQPVINGGMASWNTTTVSDSTYQLRLHVWLNDGTETFALVTGLRVSNRQPTAVPTRTPTPRPNRAPVINPIPSQQVNAGASISIPVITSDPDGDTVNLLVTSSNLAIATSSVTGVSQISVTGVTAGAATITVTANDNRGGLTSTAFIVTVQGQNRAPTVTMIQAQTVEVGQTKDVPLAVSDPDGDPVTVSAQSDNTSVVTATAVGTTAVRLTGVDAGTANVTVSATDSRGALVQIAFSVTVGRPNQPPTISPIPAQSLRVRETLDVPYTASDPDADPLQHNAVSDTPGVVTAGINVPGAIRLIGVAPGTATVTLTVTDNIHPATIATFAVTVVQGNAPPTVNAVPPQTLSVNETRDVGYSVFDPDGDLLTASASSDNPGAVGAAINTPGQITLTGVSAGTATVTLTITDGINPAVSTTFTVSVAAVNLPPVIETIFPQTLGVAETITVPYTASDPDGDALSASVQSDNTGVVTAAVSAPGQIALSGAGAGTTTVTLTVTDGVNAPVSMPFTVTVNAPNMPPGIDPIAAQTLDAGQTSDVPYFTYDDEGDPLTASASSDNPGVVMAAINTPGQVRLNAVGAGFATVTVTVTDNINAPVSTSFGVTVNAPNMPPSVDPLAPQVLNVGQIIDVPFTAFDPEGDPLSASAQSDNPGAVMAAVNVPGLVTLNAAGPGAATVTLTVTDGINAPVSTIFSVTVIAPNTPPTLDGVAPQVLTMGDVVNVPFNAFDPDGDPLNASAVADNSAVVLAAVNTPGLVTLNAVGAGTAIVTVTVTDNINAPVSTSFNVTVNAANSTPVIQQVGDQALQVGEPINVPISAFDPDGDPIAVVATSQNPSVVTAQAFGTDTVQLQGVGAGVTSVTVVADDARGGVASMSFNVTVSSAPSGFDLGAYPVLPDISGSMAQFLAQLYQSGVTNYGNRGGAFVRIGDQTMDGPYFLAPFGAPGYNLGGYGDLQGTIDFFGSLPVREGDPSQTSFTVDSLAAGPDYGIEDLSQGASSAACDAIGGGTRLSCEMALSRPSIALVGFFGPNVGYMSPEQFRSELQALVFDLMSNYGAIPVLATIPAGGGYSSDALLPYNQAIVEVASETGIPLWNLWRAMQERGIGDPTSVAPSGAGDLSEGALGYGYNVRNLTGLRVLKTVREAVGIN